MRGHLELRYHSERTADDHVLKAFPPTIKKKVLRHMYSEVLSNCYLFAGCKARFLDELLSLARMELFMPNVSHCGVWSWLPFHSTSCDCDALLCMLLCGANNS